MNENLVTLDRLLAFHDWYYDYSDDHSVWTRGVRERDAINAEQKRLIAQGLATAEEVQALTDKYRPKNG
jgi:hypothetical protein